MFLALGMARRLAFKRGSCRHHVDFNPASAMPVELGDVSSKKIRDIKNHPGNETLACLTLSHKQRTWSVQDAKGTRKRAKEVHKEEEAQQVGPLPSTAITVQTSRSPDLHDVLPNPRAGLVR